MDRPLVINNPVFESPIFLATIGATEDVVGNQGGTWSGKTFSIIQGLLYLTISTKYVNEEGTIEPIITTIVGQDVPNLKKGAINDFHSIIDMVIESFPENIRHIFEYTYHQTDKICKFSNGSRIEFSSFKNWQDAKSGKRHYVFINEANGISYKIAEQLMFRAKIRSFVDYNPDAPFWYHHYFLGKENVKTIYSNLSHNKFVPDKVRRELLAKGELNAEFKKVYILGKTGQTEGVVFPHVTWVQSMPEKFKKESYGMDFGFTNDPTTLVRIVESEGSIYIETLIYERGLTSSGIVERLEELNISKQKYIFCDSASPQTIAEINRNGYRKVRGARKGAGSILAGIDLLKSYGRLYIVDNINFKSEQLSYKWLEDKVTGLKLNEPVDDNNHLWDATRYGMEGINKRRVSFTSS